MDFELSQEQILLQDTIKRFVAEQCPRDYVRELERSGAFPEALWQKLAEIGLLGLPVPEEYGGSGGTMLDMVVVIEELAKGALALAIPFINTVGLSSKLLCALATEQQKREILPRVIAGEIKTSFAWTEASGGTDVLSMRTTAEKSEDGLHYLVNGSKILSPRPILPIIFLLW